MSRAARSTPATAPGSASGGASTGAGNGTSPTQAGGAAADAGEAIYRIALQEIETPVMMCDRDLRVSFINEASLRTLRTLEPEIRKQTAGFSADKVVGSSIDFFLRDPTRQHRMLSDPRSLPYTADVPIGSLTLELRVRALISPAGEYVGNVVEWADVTQARRAEREVSRLIEAGQAGRLAERVDLSTLEGSHRALCEGINKLLDTIATPVQEFSRIMDRIAQGDLTTEVIGEYQNDLAGLKNGINRTVQSLGKLAAAIRESSESVSRSAGDIRTSVSDLAQRTEEQAASLQETASAMEEMTSSVKQNADSARQANQLAVGSREVAEKGGTVVRQTVLAMEEINKSSKKIADIINVIDEIAFQTNLLALNAAVEAARAGEQGRGFAVVAAEVRNLAQRSATAAKEIKTLIRDSVQKIQDGSHLVEESGRHLENIVSSVKRVTEIVSEISTASQEQSTGIEEVNTAVIQMDRFTQQNAALVEQTANAATSMEQQALEMQRLVESFKLPPGLGEGARPQQGHAPPRGQGQGKPGKPGAGKAGAWPAAPHKAAPVARTLTRARVQASPSSAASPQGTTASDEGFEEF
jgi:methyl-accepting chemotaxis protein